MPTPLEASTPLQNRLLAALPEAEYQQILPHLQIVRAGIQEVLCAADRPVDCVYFPCSGIYVNLIRMQDGQMIGTGIIGNEGVIGVHIYLGSQVTHGTATCEISGIAAKMKYSDFQAASTEDRVLHRLVRLYIAAFLGMVEQTAACNQLHPAKGRLAKWLLMIHDRAEIDQFPILHRFLSEMMGLQRPSISLAAEALQKEGAIRYSRGRMTILNRERLEESACECYQIVKSEYDRLLGRE